MIARRTYYALIIIMCLCLTPLLACQKEKTIVNNDYIDPYQDNTILYLDFNEGSGAYAHDKGIYNLKEAVIESAYTNAMYKENIDPAWKNVGISGGSLLFDGFSNAVGFESTEICPSGAALSISLWVAPRAFSGDEPNAMEKGTEDLTALVSQYDKDAKEGFILGYHRFGRLAFELAADGEWYTLWSDEYLNRYEWNHVAAIFNGDDGLIQLYLNGDLVGSLTIPKHSNLTPSEGENLWISKNTHFFSTNGEEEVASLKVAGLIDEVKLYNKALSHNDVYNYYSFFQVEELDFDSLWLTNFLSDDIYKPQYHGGPNYSWMNEPHAPMYYNGYYHLFFQFNPTGPYFQDSSICWGHLISTDMVDWRPLKEVITSNYYSVCQDGAWSGGVTYDNDGVPVILFTAGNKTTTNERLSNQNIGIARPKDINDPYLTEWVVDLELAITQQPGMGVIGEFRDAHVWKENDTWCMLVGSRSETTSILNENYPSGTALLFTTKDDSFHNWDYRGQIYEIANQPQYLGESWELPVMLPIYNKAGTIKKYLFIISPAPASRADNDIYYWVGDFSLETGRFVPDESFGDVPKLLDYGNNVFTGPSGFIDPVTGEVYLLSIMQDQRSSEERELAGWANNVGLARHVWLNDFGTDVKIEANPNVNKHEGEVLVDQRNLTIEEANTYLEALHTDMAHVRLELSQIAAEMVGIKVRYNSTLGQETTFFYDDTIKKIGVDTNMTVGRVKGNFNGDYTLSNGKLIVDIYLDRSMIEAYFNQDKAVSARSYNAKESDSFFLYATNGSFNVDRLYVASMEGICY